MKMFNKMIIAFVSTMILVSSVITASAAGTYTATVKSMNPALNYDMCTLTNVYDVKDWTYYDEEDGYNVTQKVYYVDKSFTINVNNYCDYNLGFYMSDVTNTTDNKLKNYCMNGFPGQTCFDPKAKTNLTGYGCYYFLINTSYGTKNYVDQIKFFVMVGDKPNETQPTVTVNATKTTSDIVVDPKPFDVNGYNINGNNYYKLRDVAALLSGTSKNFDVSFDSTTNKISITTKKDYTGTVDTTSVSTNATATSAQVSLTVDGKVVTLNTFNINGYNYVKLRDLSSCVVFNVEWDGSKNQINIIP